MKTIGNIFIVGLVGYFTFVPPTLNKNIETIQYSEKTIQLEKEINSKLTTIKEDKEKIYSIQKELGIN